MHSVVAAVSAGFCMFLSVAAAPAPVSFGREVRPLLSDKCFKCHGPDDKTRAANFRLDIQEGALTKIKPGDPAGSRLYIRVSNEKPALRMPPPQSGIKLTPAEVDTLKRWIEQGAKWETHWAFAQPKRPEVAAGANAIDYFIRQRLQQNGLAPSPEADRVTLLRRVTYDLTGLPPTPAEIDAFLKDASPDAYEKLVDRLLASPAYGERWARHWLDVIRFAE